MAHDSSPGEEDDAVALVRVYCGLASADESVRSASAGSLLTIAVVDDAGRLLGVHEISDDPAGYDRLGTLLVERTSGFADAAVAADSDDHMVTSLLTAAGRPLGVADDDSADDFAERFADDSSVEELQAPPAARRALGLARALQAGAITATAQPTPRELVTYKPVLAAHVAMLNGRHAAASALREVLRELYPAALRAYPDPALHLPLAVLEMLPEPGPLTGAAGRGQDSTRVADQVIAQLVDAGAGDRNAVADAVDALHAAVSESPRRGGVNKSLSPAVAETVQHAVAAVRSCDAACQSLVATLSARVAPQAAAPTRRAQRRMAGAEQPVEQPVAPLPGRAGRRSRQEPAAATMPATPRPMTAPPVAPQPVMPPPLAPRPVTPPPMAPAASNGRPPRTQGPPPGISPVSVPPPPPGMTPIQPGSRSPVPPAEAGQPFRPTLTNAAINNARAERQRTVIPSRPTTRPAAGPPPAPAGFGAADYSSLPMPAARPVPTETPEPGSRANWPLVGQSDDRAATPAAPAAPPAGGRVRPPWQSDDLPAEPPSLRLVEPQLDDRALSTATDLSDSLGVPPLRLVDGESADRNGRSSRPPRRTTLTALDRSTTPPVADEGDGDLLIFAAARSAWFTGQSESDEREWATQADTGWRAAEKAARPEVAAETNAGLPKRVPQANLVPGSPLREERPLRIVRDAASIAAHTTGYFRGWRRGQEIGGYAIGGRPGRESAGGWDFSRDGGGQNEGFHDNAGYRSS